MPFAATTEDAGVIRVSFSFDFSFPSGIHGDLCTKSNSVCLVGGEPKFLGNIGRGERIKRRKRRGCSCERTEAVVGESGMNMSRR